MLSQVRDVTQVRVKNVQPFLYWGIVKWCSFPTLLSYLVRSRYAGYQGNSLCTVCNRLMGFYHLRFSIPSFIIPKFPFSICYGRH